jgi:hypothetical protein
MSQQLFYIKEAVAKFSAKRKIVIPGKQSATRNPGFSNNSGFPLSRE